MENNENKTTEETKQNETVLNKTVEKQRLAKYLFENIEETTGYHRDVVLSLKKAGFEVSIGSIKNEGIDWLILKEKKTSKILVSRDLDLITSRYLVAYAYSMWLLYSEGKNREYAGIGKSIDCIDSKARYLTRRILIDYDTLRTVIRGQSREKLLNSTSGISDSLTQLYKVSFGVLREAIKDIFEEDKE